MALIDNIGAFLAAKITTGTFGDNTVTGLVVGENLYFGRTPAEALNAAVTIYQYEGQPPTFTMGPAISAVEHPRIQISVRGDQEDYPGAYAMATRIRNILAGFAVPDATYFPYVIRIEPLSIPNPMPYDDNNRPKFVTNFEFFTTSNDGTPTV